MAVVRPAEAGEWGAVGSAVEGQRVVKVDLRVDSGEVQAISAADKEGFNREDFSGEAFNREGFNRVDFNREALAALRELGGLKDVIPDPMTWQREQREERSLPGRD